MPTTCEDTSEPTLGPASSSRSDTKQRILDVAVELFSTRGFHESSMREIAAVRLPDDVLERIVEQHSTQTLLVEGFKTIQNGVSAVSTQRILRLFFNEMYGNPLVAAFGLDDLREANLREIACTFAVMQRLGKMRALDPPTESVTYNVLVNNYFHQPFVLKACGRSTRGVEQRTLAQMSMLARLLSPEERESSSCSKS